MEHRDVSPEMEYVKRTINLRTYFEKKLSWPLENRVVGPPICNVTKFFLDRHYQDRRSYLKEAIIQTNVSEHARAINYNCQLVKATWPACQKEKYDHCKIYLPDYGGATLSLSSQKPKRRFYLK